MKHLLYFVTGFWVMLLGLVAVISICYLILLFDLQTLAKIIAGIILTGIIIGLLVQSYIYGKDLLTTDNSVVKDAESILNHKVEAIINEK